MRCLLGEKKLKRLRLQTGLPIHHATVRGSTGHRIDLYLEGGVMASLYPDGTLDNPSKVFTRWSDAE